MSPAQKATVVEKLIEVVPLPVLDCPGCDPCGGCFAPRDCKRGVALDMLDVLEREGVL